MAQDNRATEATRNNQLAQQEDERAAQRRQRQRRRHNDADGNADAVNDEDNAVEDDDEEDDRTTGGRTAAEGCNHRCRRRAAAGLTRSPLIEGFVIQPSRSSSTMQAPPPSLLFRHDGKRKEGGENADGSTLRNISLGL